MHGARLRRVTCLAAQHTRVCVGRAFHGLVEVEDGDGVESDLELVATSRSAGRTHPATPHELRHDLGQILVSRLECRGKLDTRKAVATRAQGLHGPKGEIGPFREFETHC